MTPNPQERMVTALGDAVEAATEALVAHCADCDGCDYCADLAAARHTMKLYRELSFCHGGLSLPFVLAQPPNRILPVEPAPLAVKASARKLTPRGSPPAALRLAAGLCFAERAARDLSRDLDGHACRDDYGPGCDCCGLEDVADGMLYPLRMFEGALSCHLVGPRDVEGRARQLADAYEAFVAAEVEDPPAPAVVAWRERS